MQKKYRKGACAIYAVIAVLNGVATATVFNWVLGTVGDELGGELLSAVFTMAVYILLTARRSPTNADPSHEIRPSPGRTRINAAEASGVINSANN